MSLESPPPLACKTVSVSVIITFGLFFNKNGMSHQITQGLLQWR